MIITKSPISNFRRAAPIKQTNERNTARVYNDTPTDSIYSFARSNERMHAAYSYFSKRKARCVNEHFRVVEATGLAHQRLLTQSNRVQCDLGHRHGIAVGGIATFEPVPDNKKIRPDGRKDFGGAVIT